jgi:hypothetical protein
VAASSSRRGAGVFGGGMLAADASPISDPDVCTVIVEDMLVLIAAILSERSRYSVYLLYWALLVQKKGGRATTDADSARTRLGLTDDECIRQEVIARLCVKPHSHSQLTESICRRWHEHDKFETVLNVLALLLQKEKKV